MQTANLVRHAVEPARETGFTLVELLVVVTIIAVLLALLMPALDRAVYQAELARCSAQQKVVPTAMSTYALDFQRAYPRPGQDPAVSPFFLASYAGDDRRPPVRGYLDINATFNCPLSGRSDWSAEVVTSWLLSDHSSFWGFGYTPSAGGGRGMFKLGERWEFTSNGQTYRLDVINGDMCRTSTPDSTQQVADASHPETQNTAMSLLVSDGRGVGAFGIGPVGANGVLGMTVSWWEVANTNVRGPVDLNYAYSDGAVIRSNGVEHDDGRMLQVPQRVDDGNHGLNVLVPRPGN